jgi:sec-independent protein translocase protein TatA
MQELLVILAIVMLLFGGKRLPELGQGLGKAIRGFKDAEDETRKELEKAEGEGKNTEEEKRKEEAEEVKEETEPAAIDEKGAEKTQS